MDKKIKTMGTLMTLDHFVYVKENAFDNKFCQNILDTFEELKSKGKGYVGQSSTGQNQEIKNSYDMSMFTEPELASFVNPIITTFNHHLTEEYLGNLPKEDEYSRYSLFSGETHYPALQIQKYNKNQGHFKEWHIETFPKELSSRMFVFILYLNDVEEGGETELLYSGWKIKPKQGTLLIHPTGFPFVHRGNVPVSNDKYILTTWLTQL